MWLVTMHQPLFPTVDWSTAPLHKKQTNSDKEPPTELVD